MEKVILLNATELGYQVIRALGLHGIRSIVIYDREKDEIGRYSKYVVEAIKIPQCIEKPYLLLELLMDRKKEWAGTLIIPTKDYGVEFLSANKDKLSNHYIIATPNLDIITNTINKKRLYEIAKQAGIAVPKIFSPKSADELARIKPQLEFPCLLKPGRGHLFFRKFECKMLEIHNFNELLSHYRTLTDNFRNDDFELMICEIIPGSDSTNMIQYVSYLDQSGDLLASMTSRKLRQDPPGYGQGRVAKSEKTDDVEEPSLRLLKKLGYYGFSEIEWKLDPRDGKYKLIEVNARFIFYMSLCLACGINFPWIQYLDVVKHKKIRQNSYRENVYWIHLYKDILHTILNHKMEKISLKEYLTPYWGRKVFAVLDFKDLRPFYEQWKQHVGNMLKKIYIKIRHHR
jgi:D-aspartate ligase